MFTYYFCINSPWCYLGLPTLQSMVSANAITWKPVLIAELYKATGGVPVPQRAPSRQAYRLAELERWSQRRNLPLNPKPKFFPGQELVALRALQRLIDDKAISFELVLDLHQVIWVHEQDIADTEVLKAVFNKHGLDGADLVATDESWAPRLEANTQEALNQGVFGLPGYVVNGTFFWGQDRLDMVRDKLNA